MSMNEKKEKLKDMEVIANKTDPLEECSKCIAKNAESLLKISEISLWLDSYDDIFSDFDPRPYAERALSDDFLAEAKKASRDKASGTIELQFLVPKDKRNEHQERVIKKRLRDHFRRHFQLLQKEKKDTRKKGTMFVVIGMLLMLVATFIAFNRYNELTIFMAFLVVLLEPAGWFLFWQGLDLVIFKSKEISPEIEFYEKMTKCEISFLTY